MDRNTVLAILLSLVVYTGWALWQAEVRSPAPGEQTTAERALEAEVESEAGAAEPEPLRPEQVVGEKTPTPPADEPAQPTARPEAEPWTGTFETDRYTAVLSNEGASLVEWTLHRYETRTHRGMVPVQLVPEDSEGVHPLETPFPELAGSALGDLSQVRWRVAEVEPDGATFALERDGVELRKSIRFEPDSYAFRVNVSVRNRSERSVSPQFTMWWPAVVHPSGEFQQTALAAMTEEGVQRQPVSGVGLPGFFGRVFGGAQEGEAAVHPGNVRWIGVDHTYFLSALLPDRPEDAVARFEPIEDGAVGASVLTYPPTELPPGQAVDYELRGYAGPKKPSALDEVSPILESSVDRGWSWMTPLTRFFEWLLHAIHTVVPNYGLAIILLTIMVRIVTLPIMSRQMRQGERMRAVQPKLKALQEKHGDDRQKYSEEMMALMRREGVNPLGGCLPMLLQFPVFIGLYYALRSSFDLRHAEFFGWINDLSAPESLFVIPGLEIPFRVLPIIMGATMILQQRLTPTTMDPAQARMMMTIMPVMFVVLFYQFPSGLVLYWMVSNLLGILHQLWVGRQMRAAAS